MKTILIIDDEATLRDNLRDVLTFENYAVIEAEDGVKGLQCAREHLPDLIICDIAMPGLDGHRVLTELRHDSQTASIPVIFLTARTDQVAVSRGMALGVNAYIAKPFTIEEVLAGIRAHLRA